MKIPKFSGKVRLNEAFDFPQSRAELYKEAVQALLKTWDTSRQVTRNTSYKFLSVQRKKNMLGKIAYETFVKGQYFIPQHIIEGHIKDYIVNIPECDKKSLDVDKENILKEIESQHGLLVEREKNIYLFSHLTLQEHFTAFYLLHNQKMDCLIFDYLDADKWEEVTLLVSAMHPNVKMFLGD